MPHTGSGTLVKSATIVSNIALSIRGSSEPATRRTSLCGTMTTGTPGTCKARTRAGQRNRVASNPSRYCASQQPVSSGWRRHFPGLEARSSSAMSSSSSGAKGLFHARMWCSVTTAMVSPRSTHSSATTVGSSATTRCGISTTSSPLSSHCMSKSSSCESRRSRGLSIGRTSAKFPSGDILAWQSRSSSWNTYALDSSSSGSQFAYAL
eukprot:Amastigsp_a517062_11.p3 type:complete len:208 gc:universal Amastigsp_a517062_11:976-353(-)